MLLGNYQKYSWWAVRWKWQWLLRLGRQWRRGRADSSCEYIREQNSWASTTICPFRCAPESNEETVDQATEEVLNLAFSRLHWQPGNYEETPLDFVVVNSSEPPDPTKTPFQYFKDFVSDEMIQMLVEQNNLYSTYPKRMEYLWIQQPQKSNRS